MSYFRVPYGKAVNAYFTHGGEHAHTHAPGHRPPSLRPSSLGDFAPADFKDHGIYVESVGVAAGATVAAMKEAANGYGLGKVSVNGTVDGATVNLVNKVATALRNRGVNDYATQAAGSPMQVALHADLYRDGFVRYKPKAGPSMTAKVGGGIVDWFWGQMGKRGSSTASTTTYSAPSGTSPLLLAAGAFGLIYLLRRKKK